MRLMRGGQGRTPGAAHPAAVDQDGSLRLALDSGEERLPWLEGEEDDDDEPVLDGGRITVVVIAFLLLLLAVLGGVAWWLLAERGRSELVADGGLIEAPDGPYKLRPSNPGGREVAGTGDKSFEVAEGRNVEGRIAVAAAPATPANGTAGTAAGIMPGAVTPISASAIAGPGTQPPAATTAATAGVGVQIGAYPTREAAQKGWSQMSGRMEPLRGRPHRILEGKVDTGTIFRLQVVTESEPAARQLCATLRQSGGDCQVKP